MEKSINEWRKWSRTQLTWMRHVQLLTEFLRLENVEDTGIGGITADIVGRNIIK